MEAMAEIGKEVYDCMGSARGIKIVDGKCRAYGKGNVYSKEGIRVGKNDISLHT
jgi:hypothetical protein